MEFLCLNLHLKVCLKHNSWSQTNSEQFTIVKTLGVRVFSVIPAVGHINLAILGLWNLR